VPSLALIPWPKGLPMATTQSPTLRCFESPTVAAGKLVAFILRQLSLDNKY
jgi:hypothetical protein